MSETIDVMAEINKHTYMSHLILEGTGPNHTEKIQQLLATTNYDSSKVMLELSLNGIQFQYTDLETLLSGWVKRIVAQEVEKVPELRRKVEYLQTEEGLNEKAKELAKKMCYEMASKFEWD